jgi:hypothetical protein
VERQLHFFFPLAKKVVVAAAAAAVAPRGEGGVPLFGGAPTARVAFAFFSNAFVFNWRLVPGALGFVVGAVGAQAYGAALPVVVVVVVLGFVVVEVSLGPQRPVPSGMRGSWAEEA